MNKRKESIIIKKTLYNKKRKIEELEIEKKYSILDEETNLKLIGSNKYGYSKTSFSKTSFPSIIFLSFFTLDFLIKLFNRCKDKYKLDFYKKKSRNKFVKRNFLLSDLIYYLSSRIFIHSKKNLKIKNNKLSDISNYFINFNNFINKKFENEIIPISYKKLLFLNTHLYVKSGTEEESLLFDNVLNVFEYIGEFLVGDEKLFSFLGNSDFIRYCPSKPSQIGLWNYQATIQLSNEKNVLIFSKIHKKENIKKKKAQF